MMGVTEVEMFDKRVKSILPVHGSTKQLKYFFTDVCLHLTN